MVNAAGLRLDRVAYEEEYRVFVAQLKPEQLHDAIVEPTRKVGLELQAGLGERMLHEVDHEPGALPLLEDALDVLWQRRDGNTLTQAAYEALGGVVGALQQRADAILDALSPADQLLVQRLLVNLVAVADDTTLDTRLSVPLADLRQTVALADTSDFERVLGNLVEARLLVQDDNQQTPTVEVAHEALIRKWPRLRAWLDEDREGPLTQRRVQQAAKQWAAQNRDESLLYRGAQLERAGAWRLRLGDLEHSFLDASQARHQEQLRKDRSRAQWTRIVAGVLAMLLIGAVGAGWRACQKSREAQDGLLIAVAQAHKADPTMVATLLRETAHQDSELWAAAAVDALQTGIAETVLREHESSVESVAFSPDGKKTVTGSWDKTARIWNADGSGRPITLTGHEGGVESVAFSSDGTKVITGSRDKTARIWNINGNYGSPYIGRPLPTSRRQNYVAHL